jgi:hypothetical protein
VNVTLVPAQIGFEEAATETLAVRFGFTVITIVEEVAGLPVTHVAFEVIIQYTLFPFVNPELE